MKINILVIADGTLSFSPDDNFSLSEMLNQVDNWNLDSEGIRYEFAVTKWHEAELSSNNLLDFISKEYISQLWLFGGSRPTDPSSSVLSEAEHAGIKALMDNGELGVFATGDHENIGAHLCADIPRVRYLRFWHLHEDSEQSAPHADGRHRAETHFPRLIQGGGSSDGEEYDAMPKAIWSPIAMLSNGGEANIDAHPLFFHPDFHRLSFLPDHMHEGRVREAPSAFASDQERDLISIDFPPDSKTCIAGWTVRAGMGPRSKAAMPVIHPVVSCFDHPKISRVVTDSTFHHWTWVNIKQISEPPFQNYAWDHVRQYPRNIAAWLARIYQPADQTRLLIARLHQRTTVARAWKAYKDALAVKTEEPLAVNTPLIATLRALNGAIDAEIKAMQLDAAVIERLRDLGQVDVGKTAGVTGNVLFSATAKPVLANAFEKVMSISRLMER